MKTFEIGLPADISKVGLPPIFSELAAKDFRYQLIADHVKIHTEVECLIHFEQLGQVTKAEIDKLKIKANARKEEVMKEVEKETQKQNAKYADEFNKTGNMIDP